jgi:hypothetical protein|tara:strand:+ start:738 stop:1718 length:981 start_codon:yes stop_codon:yes gene_type:complete
MTQKKAEPKGRDFYYNPSTNEMELVSDPSPLRPTPNKKPIHQQLLDLKHWAQPETKKELNTGGYVDQEQRIYESMKLPGYETPEKSNVSYKKLKQKEKGTYPFDTPQGINHVTKLMKEEADHKLSPKEDKNIDILNKEMKLSVLKDEIGGVKKYNQYDKTTYPSDPEQRRRLKNIADLEKSLGYKSPEVNVPYKKDTRTPVQKKRDNYNIEKRLKNARGPSDWELIKQTATSWQDKQDIREIVNQNYKRDPRSIDADDRKYVDRENIEPVKIFDTTPVEPELPVKKDQDIREIVKKMADDRRKEELESYDKEYGRGGITEIVRDKL